MYNPNKQPLEKIRRIEKYGWVNKGRTNENKWGINKIIESLE